MPPLLVPATIVGKDDRVRVNAEEAERWAGVGLIYSIKEGYEYRRDMRILASTGFVVRMRDFVVTVAHAFRHQGKPKDDPRNFVFAIGDFETGDVSRYEIADLELGTTDPDRDVHLDFAILRLKQPVARGINIMTFKFDQEEIALPLAGPLTLVSRQNDFARGLALIKSVGSLREKATGFSERWYHHPNIVLFDNDTNGRASGGPLISRKNDRVDYVEALVAGSLTPRSHEELKNSGRAFDPLRHTNYGIKITGNEDFYSAFMKLYRRSPAASKSQAPQRSQPETRNNCAVCTSDSGREL